MDILKIIKQSFVLLKMNFTKSILAVLVMILITSIITVPLFFIFSNIFNFNMSDFIYFENNYLSESESLRLSSSLSITILATMLVSLPITILLSYGLQFLFVDITRNKETKISDIFNTFKMQPLKLIALNLLVGLYTFLWSLLFVIPGLIKSYSYSQALLIYKDNPTIGYNEAITKSRELMNGNKLYFFLVTFVTTSFLTIIFYLALILSLVLVFILPIFIFLFIILIFVFEFILIALLMYVYALFYDEIKSKNQDEYIDVNEKPASFDSSLM